MAPPARLDLLTTDELAADRAWTLGALGIEELPDRLRISFADEPSAEAAARVLGRRWATTGPHTDEVDWVGRWRPHARSTTVGPVIVHPPWVAVDADDAAAIRVVIDPGASFGHGAHPTTRLALAALVDRAGQLGTVLDVGCGSGVLAVVAARLGAVAVRAIDIDPVAVETTGANAARNHVDVDVDDTPLHELDGRFDLVLVNMTAAELRPLVDDLHRVRAGAVVVTGLLAGQTVPGLDGLTVDDERDGWIVGHLP